MSVQRVSVAAGVVGALLALAGCSSGEQGPTPPPEAVHPGLEETPGGSSPEASPTSGESDVAEPIFAESAPPMGRCLQVPSAQASEVTGVEGRYGKLADARYPCGAQWQDVTFFELGEGDDELAGQPASATVAATFVTFTEGERAANSLTSVVQASDSTWHRLGGIDTDEAWTSSRTKQGPHGQTTSSVLTVRCGPTLLTLTVSIVDFAIVDGNRTRISRETAKRLPAAFETVGAAVCAGDDVASEAIAPYPDQH